MTGPKCSGSGCRNKPEDEKGEKSGPHTCPFDDDIYNGTGRECDCCKSCTGDCAAEV